MGFLYDDTKLAELPHACIGSILRNQDEADCLAKLVSVLDGIFEAHGLELTDAAYVDLPEWQQVLERAKAARMLICV